MGIVPSKCSGCGKDKSWSFYCDCCECCCRVNGCSIHTRTICQHGERNVFCPKLLCYDCCHTLLPCSFHESICCVCKKLEKGAACQHCMVCCANAQCINHGDPLLCNGCLRTRSNVLCSSHRCYSCCWKAGPCEYHKTLCVTCKARCRTKEPCAKCSGCCVDVFCTVHGNPLLCRRCKQAVYTCNCLSCDRCCMSRNCLRHFSCVTCKKVLRSSNCPSMNCSTCCKARRCPAHGDPFLCCMCESVKFDRACPAQCCAACCKEVRRCRTHYLCGSCKKSWMDVGCVANCCGECCTNRRCFHAKCSCGQQFSTKCPSKKCGNCCTAARCPAHGDPSLCVECEEEEFDDDCLYYLCETCCNDRFMRDCTVHLGICRN